MDISDKITPLNSTPYVKTPVKTNDTSSAKRGAAGDQIELSTTAKELQAAREAIQKIDDVDHAKVDKIKAQIEAGTYKIDADKIAAKMIEESF